MHFEEVQVAAAAADFADPVAAPATVIPDAIKTTPRTLEGSDRPPSRIFLTFTSPTGTDDMVVQPWVLHEVQKGLKWDGEQQAAADRKFYKLGTAQTLAINTLTSIPSAPGQIYFQVTGASGNTSASKLLIGYAV